MLSSIEIAIYAAAGAVLGGFHLGALWLTVAKLASVRAPLALLFVSTGVRLAVLLGAFALISGMDWRRLAACLAGFFIVRFLTIAWLQPVAEPGRQ